MLNSGKSGCIRAKVVVFGQKWLYSDEYLCIWAKWLYSDKSGFIWAKWFYCGKVVVFGQNGCIRAKCLFGKTGYTLAKVFVRAKKYSGISGCTREKVVMFFEKWFYSDKSCCIQAKWFYSSKVVVFGQK